MFSYKSLSMLATVVLQDSRHKGKCLSKTVQFGDLEKNKPMITQIHLLLLR
jgi:hypothetical protein